MLRTVLDWPKNFLSPTFTHTRVLFKYRGAISCHEQSKGRDRLFSWRVLPSWLLPRASMMCGKNRLAYALFPSSPSTNLTLETSSACRLSTLRGKAYRLFSLFPPLPNSMSDNQRKYVSPVELIESGVPLLMFIR